MSEITVTDVFGTQHVFRDAKASYRIDAGILHIETGSDEGASFAAWSSIIVRTQATQVLAITGQQQRRRYNTAPLDEVAAIARSQQNRTGPTINKITDTFKVSPRTASRWLREAREHKRCG